MDSYLWDVLQLIHTVWHSIMQMLHNNDFLTLASEAIQQLNQAIDAEDQKALLASLRLPALGLVGVLDGNASFYLDHFTSYREHTVKVLKQTFHIS